MTCNSPEKVDRLDLLRRPLGGLGKVLGDMFEGLLGRCWGHVF